MNKNESIVKADMQDWTVKDLIILKQSQLMELFKKLPCPTMQEMQGEFRGYLLNTGPFWFIRDICAHFALNSHFSHGRWLGKGFESVSEKEGRGYNFYLKFWNVNYVYPMKTYIGKSVYDGKDEFELDYTVYYSMAGFINMVDEVRRVNNDLYLGIGTWGYFRKWRRIPWFFALTGPRGRYAGIKPHRESNRNFIR
jgi:hypothetical protein